MTIWQRLRPGLHRHDVATLRTRLASFRALVDANNRVLTSLADAGEKLGGEYIFDAQYVKALAEEVRTAVHEVTYHLNIITADRHADLVQRVAAIDAALAATIDDCVTTPESALVLPFEDVGEEIASVVGEKMARLGEIRNALGCTVPEGFIISGFACQRFTETAGIPGLVAQLGDAKDLGAVSARLRESILRTRVPSDLARAVRKEARRFARARRCPSFAVRSSAIGEDGEFSFAGQYATELGVVPENLLAAYRRVIASLFSEHVMAYRERHGMPSARGLMAVGCLCLVDARVSGVLYTLDPSAPDSEAMLVSAAPGLGKIVVEGSAAVDTFALSREEPHRVVSRSIASKREKYVAIEGGGVAKVPTGDDERDAPALSDAELAQLAAVAVRIERYMKRAQDIEWAFDTLGRLVILQARPLHLQAPESISLRNMSEITEGYEIVMAGAGTVACRGIGHGPVQIVDSLKDPSDLAPGCVLVARTPSPRLAAAVARASAVITDLGTATGHLAAIAREFRVPTLVDTRIATDVLRSVREVTVDAEENVVYRGKVPPLLRYQLLRSSSFEGSREFRLLRRLLRSIAPLNLKDPLSPDFSAANCTTYHDVIRFAHEKAVLAITEGTWLRPSRGSPLVRQLTLEVPLELTVVDLGGGFDAPGDSRIVTSSSVTSAPLQAIIEGLGTEGAWETGPADMDLNGFMSSATRSGPLVNPFAVEIRQNLALVSGEYLHLSLKLGYHFNVVDCFLTERQDNNFIYFRFSGGVTEITRRSRRADLLKRILQSYDFVVEGSQDLVIGRIKNIAPESMVEKLRMVGRLIGFTRQLDISLREDAAVERYIARFLQGKLQPPTQPIAQVGQGRET